MNVPRILSATLLALFAVSHPDVRADAVTDWNLIASDAISAAISTGRPFPMGAVDFAMTHAAIHDAVQAIEGRYRPYHAHIPGASGSTAAATARAARDVLLGVLPAAQHPAVDAAYAAFLASHGIAPADPGIAVGAQAAAGILAMRLDDGRFPSPPLPPFLGANTVGQWRPTPSLLPGPPPSFAPGAVPWFADLTPLTLNSPEQFRAAAPPALGSTRYARDYDEVKSLGARFSTTRTEAQTEASRFHTDNALASTTSTVGSVI
jgi:hypothetical protein